MQSKVVTKNELTPEQYIEDQLGLKIDDIKELSVNNMSPALKKAALAFMPQVLWSMIQAAIGEEIYTCEHCEETTRVNTGSGNFQDRKFLLERALDWFETVKTMNASLNVDVTIPAEVLTATEDKEVYRAVMRDIILKLELSKPQMMVLYDSVEEEIKDVQLTKEDTSGNP